jgi:hypothetical protein
MPSSLIKASMPQTSKDLSPIKDTFIHFVNMKVKVFITAHITLSKVVLTQRKSDTQKIAIKESHISS